MANWKTLSTYTYKDEAETIGSGAIKIKVQYDKDSMTLVAVKIRFEIELLTSAIKDTTDGYYILYNANNYPESIGRRVMMLKAPAAGSSNSSWIQDQDGKHITGTISLSKEYDDPDFTIQDFWVCNVGKGTVSGQNVTYASGTKTFYEWFQEHGTRREYAARFESEQLEGPVPTNVGKGTISITDNYNNTFTVKGTKGAAGNHNPVKSYSVTYGYDSYASISAPATPIALTITTSANATRTVWAKTTTKGTYGEDSVASTYIAIKQYVAPSNPGAPVATTSAKLTAKESWNFIWVPATAANTSSPIKGYRIRVFKNGTLIKGLEVDTGNKITKGSGTTEWLDRESTSTSLVFIPEDLGFATGDKLKISLYAYTRNGMANTGSQIFSGNGSTAVYSSEYTVESAGVMHLKVDNEWHEGQVYVNVAGIWKEADSVYIKADGKWRESI